VKDKNNYLSLTAPAGNQPISYESGGVKGRSNYQQRLFGLVN